MKRAELNRNIRNAFFEIERMRLAENEESYANDINILPDIGYSEGYMEYIQKLLEKGWNTASDKMPSDRNDMNKSGYRRCRNGLRRMNKNVRRAACAAACIMLVSGAVVTFNDDIRNIAASAAQHIFAFIPGVNSFVENDKSNDVFAMQGSVSVDFSDGYIKVNSAYIKDGLMKMTIEGNVNFNGENGISVKNADSNGNIVIRPDEINWMNDENGIWSAACVFSISANFDSSCLYYLNINEHSVPVVLTISENISENVNFYYDADIGISIAAVTDYTDNGSKKLCVALVSKSDAAGSELNFSADDVKLVNSYGNIVAADSCLFSDSGQCILTFDTIPGENTKLVISNAQIMENFSKSEVIRFKAKRGKTMKRCFDINGKQLEISKPEWHDYFNDMRVRMPDGSVADAGSDAQKVGFRAVLMGKASEKLTLKNVELKPTDEYVNHYEYNGINLIYDGGYAGDSENGADGAKSAIIAYANNIRADVECAEIEICGVSYQFKNDIVIGLAV